MIVRFQAGATEEVVQEVRERLERAGLRVLRSPEPSRPILALAGKLEGSLAGEIAAHAAVERMDEPALADVLLVARGMRELPSVTWRRFIFWLAAGMIIYWGAGVYESKLADRKDLVSDCATNRSFIVPLATGFGLLLAAVIGLVVSTGPHGISGASPGMKIGAAVALMIAYAGLVFWVRGCCGYAFSKGRSRWLGMVGLSGPIGLLLIALLPPKPSTAAR